jgi:excisionase family DNA binding protein
VTTYISTKQAADALGVSDARVRQLIAEGKLPAQKIGRDHLIAPADVKALAAGRARQARSDLRVTRLPEGVK